jgi:YHS domain-containing protein
MNTKSLILGLAVLGLSSGFVLAQEAQNTEVVQVVTSTTPTSNAVEVGNKICPVSGDKVPAPGEKGQMGSPVKIMYKGRIYNLCCPMCVKDFKKNPEKYSAIADKEVSGNK